MAAPPRALEDELRAAAPIPPIPPRVPVGVPSELAERRPDIRAAEARLHAATASIGMAVGGFYPRMTLSANPSLQAMSSISTRGVRGCSVSAPRWTCRSSTGVV